MSVETILQDYELKYRLLSENTTMGMFQLTPGPESRVLSANRVMARMLGYNSSMDLVGKTLSDLISLPEDVEELSAGIRKDGSFCDREIRLRCRDGSEIWVAVQAWKLGTPEVPVLLIEGFVEDITERRVFEQEMHYHESELNRYALALAQANRKLNLLATITRHDILNQLTALMLVIDLMQNSCHDENLNDHIQRECEIAKTIEQQILFTKDYHDIGVSTPLWYNVKKGIQTLANSLPLAPGMLTIDQSVSFLIYADPLIEKVFYNLMENALRYGSDMVRITFSAHIRDGDLVLICEDNGPGVPAQYKAAIFTRQHFSHTGFGLFLSREILGITGLLIRETGEPNKGARFEIIIPPGSFKSLPA